MELLFISSLRNITSSDRSTHLFLLWVSISIKLLLIGGSWLGSYLCPLNISLGFTRRHKHCFACVEPDRALRRLRSIPCFNRLVDNHSLLLNHNRSLILGRNWRNRLSRRRIISLSFDYCPFWRWLLLLAFEVSNVLFLKLFQVQYFILVGPQKLEDLKANHPFPLIRVAHSCHYVSQQRRVPSIHIVFDSKLESVPVRNFSIEFV